MSTGIITILIVVALTRIYKIRKNGGVTNVSTEIYSTGAHLISSFIIYAILSTFI
jgi:sorbitol-specific phosphotransferase system component IIC